MESQFIPGPLARNPHIQTIMGSLKLRLSSRNPMVEASKEMIIDGMAGTRLLGYYSQQSSMISKGLIILIHGWEGSSDSTYVLSTGRCLFEKGYDIFRLNLRDHGNSHHLNEGLFHGALIDETFQSIRNIASLSRKLPNYIIGFSLGANFALRVALKNADDEIPRLRHVFCVSPALDPYKATLSIDESFFVYRNYFLNKWKRSLKKKQSLFPERYDFQNILKEKTCMGLTEAIMPHYPDFKDTREYFNQYTLLYDAFSRLTVPVTIIASQDDPVIPVADLYNLQGNRHLNIMIQKFGGHCGFLNFFPFDCWYEEKIGHILSREQ
jgi:hypothetical protein